MWRDQVIVLYGNTHDNLKSANSIAIQISWQKAIKIQPANLEVSYKTI